jgi:hypothetical protein
MGAGRISGVMVMSVTPWAARRGSARRDEGEHVIEVEVVGQREGGRSRVVEHEAAGRPEIPPPVPSFGGDGQGWGFSAWSCPAVRSFGVRMGQW